MIPNILSVAGTDPSGGAGIHADIKAISANGAYAMAVVTVLVAQTTTGVTAIHDVGADFVTAQLDTLCADVRVDAVKIGLLPNASVIAAVVAALERWTLPRVVVDPVLVATSGDALAGPDAVAALRDQLLPKADLITPNVPEAAALLDVAPAADVAAMRAQAVRLLELGPHRVLLKGGHLTGPRCVDVLATRDGRIEELVGARVVTTNDHGTGCTLSAAIAALRPQRPSWSAAIADAKRYLTGALEAAGDLEVGAGHGPVHHFWALRARS
ncbi:MAG TPA: bifunctional hydroxymethylpyrimidine kinase/phosphomethylpyrimidine kinase [Acidimicrobiales bacterium]|jgi:hydroxymethylpyrimidine/phosphomethylpyrimidine kinase